MKINDSFPNDSFPQTVDKVVEFFIKSTTSFIFL